MTNPPDPILILADDLTGAADSAARCRGAGLPATILLGRPRPPLPAGVVAFTSDSRHLPAEVAAQRVANAVNALRETNARWYKKIDSTLRGNLGAELDAMLEALKLTRAVVCPAFPAQGRGVENGYLVAPGVPRGAVSLPALLAQGSSRRIAAILCDADLPKRIRRAAEQGAEIFAVDAQSDDDLERVLTVTEKLLPGALLCGSAGLAGVLAKRAAPKMKRLDLGQKPGTASWPSARRALVVVGSGSSMAHRQLHRLHQHFGARLRHIVVAETVQSLGQIDPSAPVWALHLPRPAPDAVLDGPVARQLADRLATVAVDAIEALRPDLLITVGGDTSLLVLHQLGVERLDVLAELLPGMPLCRGIDRAGQTRLVILKAGNHGDESTLVTLLGQTRLPGADG